MEVVQIQSTVDLWIRQEELAVHPHLRRVTRFSGLMPDDEDERIAFWDFISWFERAGHESLLMVPKRKLEKDFWELRT